MRRLFTVCARWVWYSIPMPLLVFSLLPFDGVGQAYKFKNVAIGGGGFVSGIVTSRTEQGLMYARTDVGGAYRWDAANSKWVPLLDWVSESETGYLGVESIAIDPVAPNKVYMLVGTSYFNNGKSAILRSDDYGNTFSITDVTGQFKAHGNGMGRQTGEKLVVDPNLPGTLYCGTRANGLFRSINSGATWTRVGALDITTTSNENGISFVILDPSTGTAGNPTQTIIVGVSRNGTTNMYRSNDGGTSFTAIAGAPAALMPHRAALTSDRQLYITYANNAGPWDITGTGAILKYDLASGVWTNVTPAPFAGAFGGISVDPNDPDRLVASSVNTYQAQDASWGDRIFTTTNGGTSWVDVVARGFERDANGSPWIEGNAIHWAGSIEFDPFDTKKVWVISGNGVFQTDDIDATTNIWKFQVNGLEETVPFDMVSIPNGPGISIIGDYDGFRHTDVAQYASIHTPRIGTTTGLAVASLNPGIMVRVGDTDLNGGKIGYRSEDMGITWTSFPVKAAKGNLSLSADGIILLHAPEGGNTFRSIDNGVNWTTVTGMGGLTSARPVADPVNAKKFYAYNNNTGVMMVSVNGGVSFSAGGSPGTGGSKIIRLAPDHEGDIWIALYGGGLTRSVNGGQSFTKINSVTSCGAVGFGKEAPGKTYPTVYIYATVNSVLGIYRSIDEGTTWTRLNDDDHEYGGLANGQFVVGDMNVYGRFYMSTAGRGIVYGEPDNTCYPDLITPYFLVNGEAADFNTIATVEVGSTVKLSPEAASGGSWSWKGPGSFSSSEREVTLSNIQGANHGIYSVQYTNAAGCTSAWQTFAVNVNNKVQGVLIKGQDDVTSIEEVGGTLQLLVTVTPDDAADKSVTWSITSGNAFATLSPTGVLTAVDDGEVTVRATANDGSGAFGEIKITITNQNITSVEEITDRRFLIYPNPVYNELVIQNASAVRQVRIFDPQGRTIKLIDNNHSSMNILLGEMPAGFYILELRDNQNAKFVKRLVKY